MNMEWSAKQNVVCWRKTSSNILEMKDKSYTGQAVLIKIHVFCQDQKGYHLQFLQVICLYYGEAGMRIERCREDCYDLSNLQAAEEQLSEKCSR